MDQSEVERVEPNYEAWVVTFVPEVLFDGWRNKTDSFSNEKQANEYAESLLKDYPKSKVEIIRTAGPERLNRM
jgi:hypothetical protein